MARFVVSGQVDGIYDRDRTFGPTSPLGPEPPIRRLGHCAPTYTSGFQVKHAAWERSCDAG